MSKFRNRIFLGVLYEEDETHLQAIEKIRFRYNYAMIRHDMDETEEGEKKKPHYHIILKFDNARWSTSVAEELGITDNYLEPCKKLSSSLLYLIHYRDYDKYLYKIEDVEGPLKTELIKLIMKNEKDENVKVSELYEWINKQPRPLTVSKFSRWCYENGYWDIFRRSSVIFFKIIEEHNFNKDTRYLNNYEEIPTDEFFYQLGTSDMFND